MDSHAEHALVARLRAGDAAAFDQVYAAYRPRVFAFLVRLCGRRDLAEDLMQETWMRLARSCRTLAPDSRLGAWLFTVARNQFLSHCRRPRAEGWTPEELERALDLQGGPRTPFEEAAATEGERRLERALARLPLPAREVLLLVGVEHMEAWQAAEVLGIKPEALRQRLSRARTALAELLQEPASAGGAP